LQIWLPAALPRPLVTLLTGDTCAKTSAWLMPNVEQLDVARKYQLPRAIAFTPESALPRPLRLWHFSLHVAGDVKP